MVRCRTCERCGSEIVGREVGRPRTYCKECVRQRKILYMKSYRKRQAGRLLGTSDLAGKANPDPIREFEIISKESYRMGLMDRKTLKSRLELAKSWRNNNG